MDGGAAGGPSVEGYREIGAGSDKESISATGRYVAFESCATNLVEGDTNLAGDMFRWDRRTGAIVRVDVSSSGAQTPALTDSYGPSISANGRYVAFSSYA